jgi:PDZ domain-containing protein
MRSLTPARAAGAAILLAAVALLVLYLIPSNDYYVFLPDRAHALGPLVKIGGEERRSGNGGVYFVDVRFRKARLLEDLLGQPLARRSTLVKVSDVLAGGISAKQQRRIDLSQMEASQKVAAALALKRAGRNVRIRLPVVVIRQVEANAPAHRVIRAGDRLVAVDGGPVRSVGRLRQILATHRPGDVVSVRYRRGSDLVHAEIKTIADPLDANRAVIGVLVEERGGSTGKLPVRVRIDTRGVGGPSAGLAFALDLLEELGVDVDRGYKVAATGELELDGTVVPIGAVKQKTFGAREAGVDVFLVPTGSNAREARRYADGLRVIPVQSFPQALHALATLPEKHPASA